MTRDLNVPKGVAVMLRKRCKHLDELRKRQSPGISECLKDRNSLLVTNQSMVGMRLAVRRLLCGLDGLDWRIVSKMVEVLFYFTAIQNLVWSWYTRQGIDERTVEYYLDPISHSRKGKRGCIHLDLKLPLVTKRKV